MSDFNFYLHQLSNQRIAGGGGVFVIPEQILIRITRDSFDHSLSKLSDYALSDADPAPFGVLPNSGDLLAAPEHGSVVMLFAGIVGLGLLRFRRGVLKVQ